MYYSVLGCLAHFSVLSILFVDPTAAVLHGDEVFSAITDGYWYVFCDGGNQTAGEKGPSVDIVDPYSKTVVKSIPVDKNVVWSDSVYMETCDCFKKTYAIANDRNSNIVVINAQTKTVEAMVPVSDRPVHSYAIPGRQEYWTHADGAGVMDVLHISGPDRLHEQDIIVHHDKPGHGKLLWDPELYPLAYLSNTREPYIYEINLQTYKNTRSFNFTAHQSGHAWYCPGTHGMAYSRINHHIYATCSSGAGLIEVNPKDWQIVTVHKTAGGGQVYESPDEKYIVCIDKYGDAVHILKPQSNGAASTIAFPSVMSPIGNASNPGKPGWFKKPDGTWRMFFSLTGMGSYGQKVPSINGSNGMAYIDISTVEAEPSKTHRMVHVPGGLTTGKYRSILGGGGFVATIMHLPFNGLNIVNGLTGKLHATVETNKGTTRVLWVPNAWSGLACSMSLPSLPSKCTAKPNSKPNAKTDAMVSKSKPEKGEGVPIGQVVGISIAVSLLTSILVVSVFYCCYQRFHKTTIVDIERDVSTSHATGKKNEFSG